MGLGVGGQLQSHRKTVSATNKDNNNIPKQQPKPGFGRQGLGSATK